VSFYRHFVGGNFSDGRATAIMSSALAEPLLTAAATAAQSPPSTPPRPSTPRNASRGSLTRGGRTPPPLSPLYVHSQTAAAEEYDFPHDTFCAHCRSTRLSVNEARWGTRLCDGCYDAVVKDCKHICIIVLVCIMHQIMCPIIR
jgi:hypothetical protein